MAAGGTNLIKKALKELLLRCGYQIRCVSDVPRQLLDSTLTRVVEFDDVVCRHMMKRGHELTFIQVGAFDGITGDPLRKYVTAQKWRGVLVEPQAKAADRLRTLYRDNDRVTVLQAAIDCERRQRALFTVREDEAPEWAGALASFDRSNIEKHAKWIPNLRDRIQEEVVNCVPFDDVISLLPKAEIDLLQVDVEGADAYILSVFPFEQVQPDIVHWERKHLSKKELESCMQRLEKCGYRFAQSGLDDMIAVRDVSSERVASAS